MVPGMGHCSGGDGTSTFDMVTALEQWVEEKHPPERIAASRVRNGKVERHRPLCPFPQVAVYQGTGSTDEDAEFCVQDGEQTVATGRLARSWPCSARSVLIHCSDTDLASKRQMLRNRPMDPSGVSPRELAALKCLASALE